MTKAHHRRRPVTRQTRPHQPPAPKKRKINKTIPILVLIAILAAIPFSMGKYIEFNSPGAYDCGAYVYSAAHILNGARIGIEEVPSAQLGTLLVNMLGVKLFGYRDAGPKTVQLILQAAALVLLFVATRRLFGTLAAAVAVIIASVYLSAPAIAKFGNVKEQFMIAFMVMGMSCFILYELGGKWWYGILAGAFLSWGGLFKQTGVSAIGAVGLFVLLQPVLKHKTWKQMGRDALLLLAGAAAGLGPLYFWILIWRVQMALPYSFVWETLASKLPFAAGEGKAVGDYIGTSRQLVPFSEQWPRVLRYYGVLILPVALAAGAILARAVRLIPARTSAKKPLARQNDRFVLLLGVWWLLDMAFVWISPRSYEQYYLPLNASAAMLGAYLIACYHQKMEAAASKPKWIAVGAIALLIMIVMSWHIFFGIGRSPHSGTTYIDRATGKPAPRNGYSQRLRDISWIRKNNIKADWEKLGEYIRDNSRPTDKMYVWGWWPGIYVKAQRFSSASKAFCMPRPTPAVMEQMVAELLAEFGKDRPRLIVDARKRHIPVERPPYELWPIVIPPYLGTKQVRFLKPDKDEMDRYDRQWTEKELAKFGADEVLRYHKLRPLREFVINNYRVVRVFGQHVLFELKQPAPTTKPQ